MSIHSLARHPATVSVSTDSGSVDEYNNPVPAWVDTPTFAYGRQKRTQENTNDGGLVAVDEWQLWWIDDIPAMAQDRITIDGVGTFELYGPSWRVLRPQTQAFSHREALARMAA